MTQGCFYGEAIDRSSQEKSGRSRMLCLNMDFQIVTGYDDNGFNMGTPWDPNNDTTPPRLSFGTWQEFGEELHFLGHTQAHADGLLLFLGQGTVAVGLIEHAADELGEVELHRQGQRGWHDRP